jgi:hypothetical protein
MTIINEYEYTKQFLLLPAELQDNPEMIKKHY